jgi:hypothetical protein
MADRQKDKEELRLEALFQSDPLPDEGFSRKVMLRVRRQMWVRRLTMPVALIIGGSFAIMPVSDLVIAFTNILTKLPASLIDASVISPALSASSLPQLTTILASGLMAIVALIFIRTLAD